MKVIRAFEWNEAKRLANFQKHGIDFEDVGPAFDDEGALQVPDG